MHKCVYLRITYNKNLGATSWEIYYAYGNAIFSKEMDMDGYKDLLT